MQPTKAQTIGGTILAAGAVAVVLSCRQPVPTAPAPGALIPTQAARVLPDPKLTPGATNSALTAAVLCSRGFTTTTVRNVPQSEKDAVYREYGLDPRSHPPCEVDHLISLELGGSNDIHNLWPEPYDLNIDGYDEGAHAKDQAENATHKAVCDGKLTLAAAQAQIATDWRVLYERYVAPTFPRAK